jgi:hypothetical protein
MRQHSQTVTLLLQVCVEWLLMTSIASQIHDCGWQPVKFIVDPQAAGNRDSATAVHRASQTRCQVTYQQESENARLWETTIPRPFLLYSLLAPLLPLLSLYFQALYFFNFYTIRPGLVGVRHQNVLSNFMEQR